MSHEVLMPQLGMAQNSAVIVSWNKSVGDAIKVGEALLEVETDKAVMEVESRYDGFLAKILSPAGSDVPIGDAIALISSELTEAGVDLDLSDETPTTSTLLPSADASTAEDPATAVLTTAAGAAPAPAPQLSNHFATGTERILASPKARRLALERGVNLKTLVDQGFTQPFHAADIPLSKPVNAHSEITSVQASSNLFEFDQFIEWNNSFETNTAVDRLIAQKLWVAFCYNSQPANSFNTQLIAKVTDHQDESRFWKVTGRGLSRVVEIEAAQHWDLDILDFSQSAIVACDPSASSKNTLTICANVTAQEPAISLHFHYLSNNLTATAAASWLNGIAKRCANPLFQLI